MRIRLPSPPRSMPFSAGSTGAPRLRPRQCGWPSALATVCACFGLTAFERDVLVLAAAADLDPTTAAGALPEAAILPPVPDLLPGARRVGEPHWSAITGSPAAPLAPRRAGRRDLTHHVTAAGGPTDPAFPRGCARSRSAAARARAPLEAPPICRRPTCPLPLPWPGAGAGRQRAVSACRDPRRRPENPP